LCTTYNEKRDPDPPQKIPNNKQKQYKDMKTELHESDIRSTTPKNQILRIWERIQAKWCPHQLPIEPVMDSLPFQDAHYIYILYRCPLCGKKFTVKKSKHPQDFCQGTIHSILH